MTGYGNGKAAQAAPIVPARVRILDAFEAALPATTERGAEAICREIPNYTRIATPELLADIRAVMSSNLRTMLTCLRNDEPVTRETLAFIRQPTTRRLRVRLPLQDVLQAYRIGHQIAWETFSSFAQDDESRDAALSLVAPLMQFINTISTHVAEVYVEVERLLVAEGERVRRDLLEELLVGTGPGPGPRADALRAAGLAGADSLAVISAVPEETPGEDYLPRAAAKAFGDLAAGAAAPLAVLRGDEIVAVIPLQRSAADGFERRLRAARTKLIDMGIKLTIGASTIVGGLEHLPAAHREAVDARALSGPSGLLCLCGLSAFDYLALRGDATAERLITPQVSAFVTADLAEGGALTATLLEYAAANLSAKAAADRLHIHVNTAHYRLARIAERTGMDLHDLDAVIEILIAIRLAHARAAVASD